MDDLKLEATNRTVMRKKTRFLRRQGITPVHLFGHGIESLALQCDTVQLKRIIAQAGMTKPVNLEIEDEKGPKSVFVREIQRSAVYKQLLHVDFYQVRKGEKIKVDVPIILVGESPAMKLKGRILTHGVTSLSIESLPDALPSQIEVDLSPLEDLDQAIHVKDIILAPDVTVHDDPEQLVVKVSEVAVEKVEEVVAEVEVEAEAPTETPTREEPEQ